MTTNFERDRHVRDDMERVFGLAGAAPTGDGARAPAPIASPAAPVTASTSVAAPRSGRRWILFAAPLLVAVFVIVLAVKFAMTLVPDNAAAPAAERPAATAYTATAPRPAPAETPVAEDVAVGMTPDDFGPAPIDDRPATAVADLRDAPAAAPAAASPVADRRPADRRSRAADCPPGSEDDGCIYQDVVGADRRLRAAYDDAARAGVPTGELVAIRRRWDRARAISLDAPDETIRRYNQLTDRLEDLAQ